MEHKQKYYAVIGFLYSNLGTEAPLGDKIEDCFRLRRLARYHDRLCTAECNGEGYIQGKGYFRLDDPKSFVNDDTSVFDVETARVEGKIRALVFSLDWAVEFQYDPRGYTVKLYGDKGRVDISEMIWL